MEGGKKPLMSYIYEFDSLGRPISETFSINPLKWTTSNEYNLAGQMTSLTYPDGSLINYEYDNIGALKKVFDNTTTYASYGEFDNAGNLINPGYNSLGQTTRINYGNGVNDTFQYYDQESDYPNFRLWNSITKSPSGEKYFENEFLYTDAQGQVTNNITQIIDPRFGDQTMSYDFLNRLESAQQSSPSSPDPFILSSGQLWEGYGSKVFSYSASGNILTRTKPDATGSTTDIMNYSYDPINLHAVTGLEIDSTQVFSAQYNDNGSMIHKVSNISAGSAQSVDHDYLYDAYERMVAVLDAAGYRVSDSVYHLSGGRLFEGQIADYFVQGSFRINPYFELKISSGQAVYIARHVLAGGKELAVVYDSATDWHTQGLGCATIGTRAAIMSHRQIMLSIFILFVPLQLGSKLDIGHFNWFFGDCSYFQQ